MGAVIENRQKTIAAQHKDRDLGKDMTSERSDSLFSTVGSGTPSICSENSSTRQLTIHCWSEVTPELFPVFHEKQHRATGMPISPKNEEALDAYIQRKLQESGADKALS